MNYLLTGFESGMYKEAIPLVGPIVKGVGKIVSKAGGISNTAKVMAAVGKPNIAQKAGKAITSVGKTLEKPLTSSGKMTAEIERLQPKVKGGQAAVDTAIKSTPKTKVKTKPAIEPTFGEQWNKWSKKPLGVGNLKINRGQALGYGAALAVPAFVGGRYVMPHNQND
jgi:hypothetical protein